MKPKKNMSFFKATFKNKNFMKNHCFDFPEIGLTNNLF